MRRAVPDRCDVLVVGAGFAGAVMAERLASESYEFPADQGGPYYPIPRPENRALYKRYEALAAEDPGVTFVGRLARYQYLNIDQVVGQALATFEKLRPRLSERAAADRS